MNAERYFERREALSNELLNELSTGLSGELHEKLLRVASYELRVG
jgi:hypothetical protein